VLAVVTALILGAAWWLNQGSASGAGSAVDVPAAAGPAPEPGGPAPGFAAMTAHGAALAPEPGGPAPGFAAMTADGAAVSLEALGGKPVWLSFVATWCASCRSEASDVEDAARAADGQVEVISIYLGEDANTVGSYAERLEATHLQVPDPDKAIASRYRIMSVPTHVFIDAQGRIHSTHTGVMTRAAMDETLRDVLSASGG